MTRRRSLAVGALYLACMAGFVYGIAEHQVGYGSDVANALIVAGLVALHFVTGLGAARWWVVVLPIVVVLIAIPAGYPEHARGEPLPIWFGLALVVPAGVVVMALGVTAAVMLKRRRRG